MMEFIAGVMILLFASGVGNALIVWKDQSVQDVNISKNASDIAEVKQDQSTTREKIDGIYWYLIESKGVKIPSKRGQ
jgi:hypothetical protein